MTERRLHSGKAQKSRNNLKLIWQSFDRKVYYDFGTVNDGSYRSEVKNEFPSDHTPGALSYTSLFCLTSNRYRVLPSGSSSWDPKSVPTLFPLPLFPPSPSLPRYGCAFSLGSHSFPVFCPLIHSLQNSLTLRGTFPRRK